MEKKHGRFSIVTDSHFFFYLFMLLILVGSVYLIYQPHRDMRFDDEECVLLEYDWNYVDSQGTVKKTSLPFQLEANIENGIEVSRILPEKHTYAANMVALWTSMQYVRAYLDGELIYSFTQEQRPETAFGKTDGSCWHVIRLPDGWEGRELTLELTSPYPDYVGKIKSIYLGTKASFMFQIIHSYGREFIFAVLMIIVGNLYLAAHVAMKNSLNRSRGFVYLGWFQIWGGIWMWTECGLVQFIAGNMLLTHMFSFISLMMFPVPLLLYLEGLEGVHAKKILRVFALLHMADITVVSALQAAEIVDYYETLPVSHVLIALTALVMLGTILSEKMVYHNEEVKYLFGAGMVLAVCGATELITFYFRPRVHTGELFGWGMIFFMAVMGYKTLRQIYGAVMRGNEVRYYEKLATVDFMTRCQNKTAYLKFINGTDKLLMKNHTVFAVMADLNNLKQMNDSLGHYMGDEAIKLCAMVLQENFGDLGECYRIGGDEFLCICRDCEEKIIQERIHMVDSICDRESVEWGRSFRIAIGYARYEPQRDRSLEDTVKRADDLMYIQKRRMKTP